METEESKGAKRVNELWPWIYRLEVKGYDVSKEFGGYRGLSEFFGHIRECEEEEYKEIKEGIRRVLESYTKWDTMREWR